MKQWKYSTCMQSICMLSTMGCFLQPCMDELECFLCFNFSITSNNNGGVAFINFVSLSWNAGQEANLVGRAGPPAAIDLSSCMPLPYPCIRSNEQMPLCNAQCMHAFYLNFDIYWCAACCILYIFRVCLVHFGF